MRRLLYISIQLIGVLLCGACNGDTKPIMSKNHHNYDKAVLEVDWGLYSRGPWTVVIEDRNTIGKLYEGFKDIMMDSKGMGRAEWKPQGALAFYRDGEKRWTVILGMAEWTESGAHNVEYPLPKSLQTELKRLVEEDRQSRTD